jgi:hypothetical protein
VLPSEGERQSACGGKVPYESFAEAQTIVGRLKKRRNFRNGRNANLKPYRCPHCGKYHVGNTLSLV